MDKAAPTCLGLAIASLFTAVYLTLAYLVTNLALIVFVVVAPLSYVLEPIYVRWIGLLFTMLTMSAFYRIYLSTGPGPDHPQTILAALFSPSTNKRLGTIVGLAQGISIAVLCFVLPDTDDTVSARLFAQALAPYVSGLNTIGQFFCILATIIFFHTANATDQQHRQQQGVSQGVSQRNG